MENCRISWSSTSTLATHTYVVFAVDADSLVHNASCNRASQARKAPRKRGVYVIKYKNGSYCVGKSKNMHRRMHQHAAKGRLSNVK
ncbi:GIY-YIG nuclease family protein [Streptomyces sp. NPDC002545]